MNEANKLLLCQQCLLRDFNLKSGVVCSITKEKPTFEDNCIDFKEDPKVDKEKARRIANSGYAGTSAKSEGSNFPVWRIVLSVILITFAIVRIIMRLNS